MLKPKYTTRRGEGSKTLKKDIFYTRIARASGVPKVTVKKVMMALPDVVYACIARCERITFVDGIQLEGVMKEEDKRNFYNINTGKVEKVSVIVRPRCIFNKSCKIKLDEAYKKIQEEKEGKK